MNNQSRDPVSKGHPSPSASETPQHGEAPPGTTVIASPGNEPRDKVSKEHLGPFKNEASFWLADWYWSSSSKSLRDFEKLLCIMQRPDFSVAGVIRNNWKDLFSVLGANKEDLPAEKADWIKDEGWKSGEVVIDVPFHFKLNNSGIHSYTVGSLRYRSIVGLIREVLGNPRRHRQFHYHPHQATWKPSKDHPEVSVYGELYASREFRRAYEEVQKLPSNAKNEGMERVMVALMLWSDSTCLTDFGTAKLWPCYLSFGNESKYRRSQSNEGLCHQVAYFEAVGLRFNLSDSLMTPLQISDGFFDFLKELNLGKLPTKALLTHCNRKVFHKQWSLIMDEELLDAMENGIIVPCPDGSPRCFYPRFLTYSADYPEKGVFLSSSRVSSTDSRLV